mmetsp:Transcript_57383/g.124695  ORF Transcript_57383/g.124695 Transcript_57383/m.124695 type:complete len:258 (+) Transcript_57383:664-1437(+)
MLWCGPMLARDGGSMLARKGTISSGPCTSSCVICCVSRRLGGSSPPRLKGWTRCLYIGPLGARLFRVRSLLALPCCRCRRRSRCRDRGTFATTPGVHCTLGAVCSLGCRCEARRTGRAEPARLLTRFGHEAKVLDAFVGSHPRRAISLMLGVVAGIHRARILWVGFARCRLHAQAFADAARRWALEPHQLGARLASARCRRAAACCHVISAVKSTSWSKQMPFRENPRPYSQAAVANVIELPPCRRRMKPGVPTELA